jgi:hypothetical protein
MKIRIYNDTLRLRVDRTETEQIGRGETVTGVTHFASGQAFTYQLSARNVEQVGARFVDGTIEVALPLAAADHWSGDETEVSIKAQDGDLSLLIEKDFECLDPREGEDQSNRFKNPKADPV